MAGADYLTAGGFCIREFAGHACGHQHGWTLFTIIGLVAVHHRARVLDKVPNCGRERAVSMRVGAVSPAVTPSM